MRPVSNVLERLSKVRQCKPKQWMECCSAHEVHDLPLSISKLLNNKVLLRSGFLDTAAWGRKPAHEKPATGYSRGGLESTQHHISCNPTTALACQVTPFGGDLQEVLK